MKFLKLIKELFVSYFRKVPFMGPQYETYVGQRLKTKVAPAVYHRYPVIGVNKGPEAALNALKILNVSGSTRENGCISMVPIRRSTNEVH